MGTISTLTIAAAVLMAAMGAYLTRHPSKEPNKWVTTLWIAAFVFPAGFVAWATYEQQDVSDKKIERLRKDLIGEDNFAFFQLRPPVVRCEELFITFVQTGGVENVAIGRDYPVGTRTGVVL